MDFSQLPYEVQFRYLLGLPYQTVVQYCQTNQSALAICQDRIFWERKARQDFSVNWSFTDDDYALQYAHLEEVYRTEPWLLIADITKNRDLNKLRNVLSRTDLSQHLNEVGSVLLGTKSLRVATVIKDAFRNQLSRFLYDTRVASLFKAFGEYWYHDIVNDLFYYHLERGDFNGIRLFLDEAEKEFGRWGILINALATDNQDSRIFFFRRYADLLRDPEVMNDFHDIMIQHSLGPLIMNDARDRDPNGLGSTTAWKYDEYLTLGQGVIDLNEGRKLLESYGNPPELVAILNKHIQT